MKTHRFGEQICAIENCQILPNPCINTMTQRKPCIAEEIPGRLQAVLAICFCGLLAPVASARTISRPSLVDAPALIELHPPPAGYMIPPLLNPPTSTVTDQPTGVTLGTCTTSLTSLGAGTSAPQVTAIMPMAIYDGSVLTIQYGSPVTI